MPPRLKRVYGGGDLHFITFSCYRRLPLLGTPRRRDLVLHALERVRRTYQLLVIGYVVMPEHVHLLVNEPVERDLSVVMKALKQGVARRVLRSSRQQASTQAELFADRQAERLWQHRFYDFNVFSEKKRVEKLRYMHRNPVKRGLVARPEDWRWSSYRSYAFAERGLVAINVPFPMKPVTISKV